MQRVHYEALYRHELDHWWYRVRRELVHDILRGRFGDRTDLRLLDIGCGTGALTKELERYGSCTGVDFSQQAVDFCKSRGVHEVKLGHIEATGCVANTFDGIVCLDVLEHLPEDAKGVAEIHRVLKRGGVAIIFVPAFQFLWSVTDELSDHYRRYRLPELSKKIKSKDFTIIRQSYFNFFLFPLVAFVRISVRLLRIKMRSEIATGNGVINIVLYQIFTFERRLLRYMNFPFGVSGLLIVRKN